MTTWLEIIKKVVNNIFIYKLVWEIDATNADLAFSEIFETFFWNKIIYDLSKLNHWNSRFIGYLVNMNEFVEEKWWRMCISWCIDPLKDILELAWIDNIIYMAGSIDEAIIEINSENPTQLALNTNYQMI